MICAHAHGYVRYYCPSRCIYIHLKRCTISLDNNSVSIKASAEARKPRWCYQLSYCRFGRTVSRPKIALPLVLALNHIHFEFNQTSTMRWVIIGRIDLPPLFVCVCVLKKYAASQIMIDRFVLELSTRRLTGPFFFSLFSGGKIFSFILV